MNNWDNDIESSEFGDLFRTYYKSLRAYAFRYVNDLFVAEDIVQDVFFKLWEKKDNIHQIYSVRSYLFTSVFNGVSNFIKHKKIEDLYQAKYTNSFHEIESYYGEYIANSSDSLIALELESQINEVITGLPEQCKKVFILSRFSGLKNREIADILGITVKAVEKQITKALQILRSKLQDYFSILLFLMVRVFLF